MKYLLPYDVIQAITPRHLSCPYNQDITFLLSFLIQLDVFFCQLLYLVLLLKERLTSYYTIASQCCHCIPSELTVETAAQKAEAEAAAQEQLKQGARIGSRTDGWPRHGLGDGGRRLRRRRRCGDGDDVGRHPGTPSFPIRFETWLNVPYPTHHTYVTNLHIPLHKVKRPFGNISQSTHTYITCMTDFAGVSIMTSTIMCKYLDAHKCVPIIT